MIAASFHPSKAMTIHDFVANAESVFAQIENEAAEMGSKNFSLAGKIRDGRVYADQGIIAGCAGGMFDSICEAAAILDGKSTGNSYFSLSVYPTSIPVSLELTRNGASAELLSAGALIKPSFCGPCFGAGDVPANNGFSIRHTTRNFPSREGSSQQSACGSGTYGRADCRTAANGGAITAIRI